MATTASRSEPPPEGKAKGSSNPLFALLDSPVFRVTLVVITTFVPLAALFHLVFIHGASWWRLLLSVFATIVDIFALKLRAQVGQRMSELGVLTLRLLPLGPLQRSVLPRRGVVATALLALLACCRSWLGAVSLALGRTLRRHRDALAVLLCCAQGLLDGVALNLTGMPLLMAQPITLEAVG